MKPRWILHGLVAATTLLLIAVIVLAVRARQAPPLPRLGAVPDFSLVEASQRPFRRADLTGQVWIASFIFTRCASTCPLMAEQLRGLQQRFPEHAALRLVSFTVDPDHDTAAVLRTYAGLHGADRARWFFVTGDKKQLRGLARDGFHLTAADAGPEDDEPILHSSYLVLVDRTGQIRGYYGGTDGEAVERLVRDARTLLQRPS